VLEDFAVKKRHCVKTGVRRILLETPTGVLQFSRVWSVHIIRTCLHQSCHLHVCNAQTSASTLQWLQGSMG